MVRSSGTSEAVPPTPSSPFRLQIFQSSKKKSAHRPSSSISSTSSGKGAAAAPHVSDYPERRHSIAQTEQSIDANRTIRGNWNIDRFSRSTEGTSRRSSRSNSVDLYSSPVVTSAAVVAPLSPATATALRVRPVLRLPAHSIDTSPQVVPITSSPQRRGNNNPLPLTYSDSPLKTPPTSTSEASQFWNSSPQRNWTRSDPPFTAPIVVPAAYQSAGDLTVSETSPALPKSPKFTSAHLGGRQSREPPGNNPPRARGSTKRRRREHRSQSTKEMLSSALQKANTAVTLDNAGNRERAMEAYSDACVLLGQVMMRAGAEDDRRKLRAIHETYTQRIEELRTMSPQNAGDEKELPARPLTEEFTDQDSLYPAEDDESTVIISTATAAPVGGNRYVNGIQRATAVPPRRDSLFVGPSCALGSGPMPPLPITRSRSAEPMSAPRSPNRPPRSSSNAAVVESDSLGRGLFDGSREFTFGAAALSPRFSPAKERDYGIRRSVSDASSISSRRSSHRQSGLSSNNTHSRQGSGASTSWLNTIDESGGSVSEESSPGWTKKKPRKQSNRARREREKAMLKQFEDDFDSQLDAAVEAAYDDGYEVDYTYDRDEIVMMRSPRSNVERAKERVRQVEREMELEIQKEKERRLARERTEFNDRRRDSDLDFFDDGDDESEEERMLEEVTRGYTLDDFEFNLESKTALPRESASTTYSDMTLPRESGSSGYSSGTWASSVSSAHLLNGTTLSTVAEAPPTPPPPTQPSAPISSPQEPQVPPPPPPPPLAPPLLVPPLLPPLAPTIQKATEEGTKEPIPAIPTPNTAAIPSLSIGKSSSSVRSRRLSALAEPLKVETSASNTVSATNVAAVPTTVVRGPSPQVAMGSASSSEPPHLPPVSPAPPGSASVVVSSSRPSTASGLKDSQWSNPPATAPGRKLSSPTPPSLEPPGLSVPLTKTVSDDGTSGSPARFTPRIPGIPGSLRQIQSSASLKSRNVTSPDMGSPGIPHSGLFSSSSTSNLRKAFPRSATPATPTVVPMTPMGFPLTAGLPAGGMHLFENKLNSPATPGSDEALFAVAPTPLEPCPPEPLSKPFWLMRCFYQTVAHPRGGYISARLFVPREVWFIKGVKIRAVDDKISACDLVSAALGKLATVKQDDINALFLEMQSLEGVLDRAQAVLSKKLGSDVGAPGARSLYQTENSISENHSHDMVTKNTGVSGGKSYFSLRKLRTKTSNNALASFSSPTVAGNDFYRSGGGLPMAGASTGASQQPKRNLETVTFGGPHAAYISALARLFDAAQILDRLPVFDEDPAAPEKARITAKVGLELSHRHASEFFGFYICRFVLNDISLLLDKFVKRGSEWVAQ